MHKIYLAGDSTLCTEDVIPPLRLGWGQVFQEYINDEIKVLNHAKSGRSTKSFIDEGRLETVAKTIQKGDYFLIQFGHNDQKEDEERRTEPFSTYKDNLKVFVEVAKSVGATPILVTSVCRRQFNEAGVLTDTHGDYVVAMRALALEEEILLIDLEGKSRKLFESLGDKGSIPLLFHMEPGEHTAEPEGVKDDTHFSEYGAHKMAELVVEGLKELGIFTKMNEVLEG